LATEVPAEVWALHTSRRLTSAKVKAFMRFLDTVFPSKGLDDRLLPARPTEPE